MPTISTPSKIAATKGYGAEVIFSGSTSQEREAMVAQVVERTGAILVPPYDHPNIILGQGTMALELEEQVEDMLTTDPKLDVHYQGVSEDGGERLARDQANNESSKTAGRRRLDAVITPCGGGGMLSGVATAMEGTGVRVYGAEPAFEGADDARRGLANGERITTVKTLTIADGLRTPVGKIPWSIISDPTKVQGIFAVTEEQIKNAMKLVLERMKIFVEPSAVVGLATILYNDDFRTLLAREAGPEGWNIGVVLSGGNTTVEAIAKLFGETHERAEREAGIVGQDGTKLAENVAG
ncbi:MAG: hypothetical protein M1833_005220 [Piccolia ochrophora]|nr:MAG: hypothetical protein M1833_005220 [Piccolia ochrophora]